MGLAKLLPVAWCPGSLGMTPLHGDLEHGVIGLAVLGRRSDQHVERAVHPQPRDPVGAALRRDAESEPHVRSAHGLRGTRSEERRSDPNDRGAFFDRNSEVMRHAHRKMN